MTTLYRVLVSLDDIQEDPTSWSDDVKVVSFSTRHRNFSHPDSFGLHEGPDGTTSGHIGLRRKFEAGTAFILSCYQHSGIVWSLKGEGTQCRFDTAQVAGILFQKGQRRETYEQRQRRARQFLETYNSWCNGEVYRAELQSYLEGREDEEKDLETASALYGHLGVIDWMKETCAARGVPGDECPVLALRNGQYVVL